MLLKICDILKIFDVFICAENFCSILQPCHLLVVNISTMYWRSIKKYSAPICPPAKYLHLKKLSMSYFQRFLCQKCILSSFERIYLYEYDRICYHIYIRIIKYMYKKMIKYKFFPRLRREKFPPQSEIMPSTKVPLLDWSSELLVTQPVTCQKKNGIVKDNVIDPTTMIDT